MKSLYKISVVCCLSFFAAHLMCQNNESVSFLAIKPASFLDKLGYPQKSVERRIKAYASCASFSTHAQLLADMIDDRDLFRRSSEKNVIPSEFFLLQEACQILNSYGSDHRYACEDYEWERSHEFISNPLVVEAFIVWVGRGPGTEVRRRLFAGLLLHMVAYENASIEIAQFALARGADINTLDAEGRTPLMVAISKGYATLTDLLLENGADYNIVDSKGKTAFIVALEHGNAEVTEALLNRGACIGRFEKAEDVALHIIVKESSDLVQDYQEAAILLIKRGANSNSIINGTTPLLTAVQDNNYNMAKLLVEHGAKVDLSVDGISPLRLAYLKQEDDIFALFLARGFRDLGDNERETVLHTAVKQGQTEVVKALLQAGANPNSVNKSGWTPLADAALRGHTEIVQLILAHGGWKLVYHKIDGKIAQDFARENAHMDIFGMLGGYY